MRTEETNLVWYSKRDNKLFDLREYACRYLDLYNDTNYIFIGEL